MNKEIFNELIKLGYSKKSAYAHLNGTRIPSYKHMMVLHKSGVVPFDAWQDIRTYLQDNDTPIRANKSTTKA